MKNFRKFQMFSGNIEKDVNVEYRLVQHSIDILWSKFSTAIKNFCIVSLLYDTNLSCVSTLSHIPHPVATSR